MKENLRLIICLVTGVVIGWWLSGNANGPVSEQVSSREVQSQHIDAKSKAPLVAAPNPQPQAIKTETPVIDDEQMARLKHDVEVKKREIHELMQQYDAALADKEKKQQLKQELAVLMEQYNQMVLPLAMAELDKNQTH